MIKTFWQNYGLKKTFTANLKTVNFLVVTFNLCTRKYQPYKKSNNTPTYINDNSNHPPNIIKALPNNISKRISNVSSDKATFNNAALFYKFILSTSGYKEKSHVSTRFDTFKESKTKKDNIVKPTIPCERGNKLLKQTF